MQTQNPEVYQTGDGAVCLIDEKGANHEGYLFETHLGFGVFRANCRHFVLKIEGFQIITECEFYRSARRRMIKEGNKNFNTLNKRPH